jgi:hypothetical protein
MKYWMHRIANHEEISYPLLNRGCLSIGWSEIAAEKECLAEMNKLAAAWKVFERAYENAYGELSTSR